MSAINVDKLVDKSFDAFVVEIDPDQRWVTFNWTFNSKGMMWAYPVDETKITEAHIGYIQELDSIEKDIRLIRYKNKLYFVSCGPTGTSPDDWQNESDKNIFITFLSIVRNLAKYWEKGVPVVVPSIQDIAYPDTKCWPYGYNTGIPSFRNMFDRPVPETEKDVVQSIIDLLNEISTYKQAAWITHLKSGLNSDLTLGYLNQLAMIFGHKYFRPFYTHEIFESLKLARGQWCFRPSVKFGVIVFSYVHMDGSTYHDRLVVTSETFEKIFKVMDDILRIRHTIRRID